jgi:hypothetical protein
MRLEQGAGSIRRGAKTGHARAFSALKSRFFQQQNLVPHGDRSADSLRPRVRASRERCRQVLFQHDVGKLQGPARLQNSIDLLERGLFGGGEVDDAVGYDHIEGAVRIGNVFRVDRFDLDIRGPRLREVLPGEGRHFIGQIDPAYPASSADKPARDIYIETGPAADIQHSRPAMDLPEREGVPDAAEGIKEPLRRALDKGTVVPKELRAFFAGRIFEFARR